MTSDKRWNIRTDLAYIETFYERQDDGSFVETAIPPAEIDFAIEYFTDGRSRFKATRIDGVYDGCRAVDEHSVEVFIPLSRKSMGIGELRRNLFLTIPDNNFLDHTKNICIPAKTGYYLWHGPTDNFPQSPHGEAIVATIINASYDVLDLTSSTYPETGRKIIEKLNKGIPANIYIKPSADLPLQAVVQVQKAGKEWRLILGAFEATVEDGRVNTFQVFYLLNHTTGAATKDRVGIFPELASAGDYIKKTDRIIVDGGSPADLIDNN